MAPVDESIIQTALADYDAGIHSSLRATARAYGLNVSLLSRRVNGLTISKQKCHEPSQKLSNTEEQFIVDWVLRCEASKNPVSHVQIRNMARLCSDPSNTENTIGTKWISRFLRRHLEVKTKPTMKIDTQRVIEATPEVLRAHFELYSSIKS